MQFVWDPGKAESNFAEHGIRFSEAVTVFEDDFALTREDPDSDEEQRFVSLGLSGFANLIGSRLHLPWTGYLPYNFGLESQ